MVIMVFYSPSKTQARETWAPENSGNITGSYGRTCGLRLLIHEEKDESVYLCFSPASLPGLPSTTRPFSPLPSPWDQLQTFLGYTGWCSLMFQPTDTVTTTFLKQCFHRVNSHGGTACITELSIYCNYLFPLRHHKLLQGRNHVFLILISLWSSTVLCT